MRIVAYVYLVLLAASIVWPFLAGGPEAGIFAAVLSAPWSWILVALLDSVDPSYIGAVGLAVPILGGLVNFAILMALARRGRRAEHSSG